MSRNATASRSLHGASAECIGSGYMATRSAPGEARFAAMGRSGPLVVDDLDPTDARWGRLVETARGATPYHHPTLVRAAASDTGLRLATSGAWRGDELVGVLAVVVRPEGYVRPRALAAYNAPVVAPSASAAPLVRRREESTVVQALLAALVRRHPTVSMRMVPGDFEVLGLIAQGWTVKVAFTYHVDISDPVLAWRRIDENRRRLIRRGERRGVVVREIGQAPAEVVEWVMALNNEQHDHYEPGHSVLDPEGWRSMLPELLATGVARLFAAESSSGEPVAFALMSASAPLSVMLASGASRAHLDDGATALLRWRVMQQLGAEGVGSIDLAGARSGPSGRFKASFGGQLVERWELRSPPARPTWRTIPRRAAHQVRADLREIRADRREK